MKIKELFLDKSKWTKGALFRNEKGEAVSMCSKATKYCLAGVIQQCYTNRIERWDIEKKIEKEIGCYVVSWNDDPERTFEEVKELVERLDI